ncbi:MAG TPA: DNA-formamidopyrimidine glycosylase family protein [Candidatus Nanopelagicales bacterium]|nr:DNA-formamidopyrimidine glycosylase family protein [Candidatus Nanopelagicales bacterium]
MPELPEVESLAAYLRATATGLRVARVELAAISALKTFDPPVTDLVGARIVDASRRGKFLDVVLVDEDGEVLHLVTHLARAGWLHWRKEMSDAPPRPGKGPLAFRVVLVDDDGVPAGGFDLTEAGTKKGLAVYVTRDPSTLEGIARLGPEPLDGAFTVDVLAGILREAGGKQIKGVLREQGTIAGIGNAYSDDILHAARLSPYKAANKLDAGEIATLHQAIHDVLTDAVTRSQGLGAADLKAEKKLGMRVHGRAGQPCPVCGDTVREVSFADSSLQYCPTCQTDGKPLADRRTSKFLK